MKYQTFATWAQKRKRQRGQYPKPPPEGKAESKVRWLEASVQRASALSGSGLLLHLPGSVRAEIINEQQAPLAAALVRALEKPC